MTTQFTRRFFALVCLLAPAITSSWSQETRLAGAQSGWVHDPDSRSVRAVIGVPGAAYLGPATLAEIDVAAVAPNGSRALVVREGKTFLVSGLYLAQPAATLIEETIESPDRIVWAADSSAALLYSQSPRILQRLSLAGTPRASAPRDLSSLGGLVTTLAIESDTGAVVVGIADPESGGLYLASQDSPPSLLAPMLAPSAFVFAPVGDDAVAVDAATRRVLSLRQLRGAVQVLALLDERDGVSDPVGLALSPDGRLLFVAERSASLVRAYDTSSGAVVSELPLDAPPSGLEPLAGGGLFLLNHQRRGRDPLLVLDPRPAATVWFVPAGER